MLNDGFSEKIASPVEDTPRTSFQSRSTFRTPVAIIFLFLNNRIPTAMPLNLQDKFPRVSLGRSEEHTSELQSLMRISYAVFCLKKKKRYNIKPSDVHIQII